MLVFQLFFFLLSYLIFIKGPMNAVIQDGLEMNVEDPDPDHIPDLTLEEDQKKMTNKKEEDHTPLHPDQVQVPPNPDLEVTENQKKIKKDPFQRGKKYFISSESKEKKVSKSVS